MADFDMTQFLPYLLNQAAEASSQEFQRHYKDRYGMLRTEWRVLFHIGQFGELTAKDIVTRAGIHKTKVSRAVAALEHKRFLTREVKEQDRRQETLSLTPLGRKVHSDLVTAARAYDERLCSEFDHGQIETLRSNLRRIAKASTKT